MSEPRILRLHPGDDLRPTLEALAVHEDSSWFLVSGIGSLTTASIRFAGAANPKEIEGPLEIVSLSGSVGPDGAHLHALVADAAGAVIGGHICAGCLIATTAELALVEVRENQLRREFDERTGYPELVVLSGTDSTEEE